MSTDVYTTQLHEFVSRFEHCGSSQCVKGDPTDFQAVPFHSVFGNTTHSVLRVEESESPSLGPVQVNVFNGTRDNNITLKLKSTDTIGKLKQKYLKMNPDLGGSVDLAYNGKPVEAHQTLAELQVKPGATFITYHRCRGG